MKTRNQLIPSVRVGQSIGRTVNNHAGFRRFVLRLGGFFLIAACALSPSRAQAECKQWDVTGTWALQGSDGTKLFLDLQQRGTSFVGALSVDPAMTRRRAVSGNIHGSDFYMEEEVGGVHGVFRGTVGAQGRIDGSVKYQGFAKLTWFSTTVMKCADVAAAGPSKAIKVPAAPPRPGTIIHTGKVRGAPAPTPRTDLAARASSGDAHIGATPRVPKVPAGQKTGHTILVWDGGANHPYAEVWVKVDDEEEKFVVEKGKGTRGADLELGKTYLYILTDAGERLATVTVKAER